MYKLSLKSAPLKNHVQNAFNCDLMNSSPQQRYAALLLTFHFDVGRSWPLYFIDESTYLQQQMCLNQAANAGSAL